MRKTPLLLLLLLIPISLCFSQVIEPNDYPIGISDLLDINVLGVTDFTRTLRVNSNGTIRLPFLGEVELAGITPLEAEEKLAKLLDQEYVVDPQVSVIVKEPRSRMYTIVGALRKPGQYQMLESITLVNAIAGAGGLDLSRVGDVAFVQRNYPSPDKSTVQAGTALVRPFGEEDEESPRPAHQISIDLKKLMKEGDLALDIPIMPGDVISIPEREEKSFFVIGDVTRPGPFNFPPEQEITITRALAMAGGPTRTSKLGDTAFIRQHPDGTMERKKINMGKVLEGKLPDIGMQPNDMLYVPGSVAKSFGWAMLNYLPNSITWMLLP